MIIYIIYNIYADDKEQNSILFPLTKDVLSKKYSSFFFVKLEEFNSTLRKKDFKLYDKKLLEEESRYIKLHRPSLNAKNSCKSAQYKKNIFFLNLS